MPRSPPRFLYCSVFLLNFSKLERGAPGRKGHVSTQRRDLVGLSGCAPPLTALSLPSRPSKSGEAAVSRPVLRALRGRPPVLRGRGLLQRAEHLLAGRGRATCAVSVPLSKGAWWGNGGVSFWAGR